eukprot:CAMPEP_0197023886 /NCGR_PEP_ID=MMETSP1384-20130603/4527_1 /TAXON_ID=29189 /ORGANISM="Ammonia sp." /LENGTH=264 /DNA_ID=CAMNT_0042452181 /DNA_START=21 /DNA_END=815 /DNA_ORIENTATION=-
MIYSLILYSKSALPIFQKEFIPNDKIRPRILTGIITAMNKKCLNIVGSPCCYLEFDKLSLSIVTNTKYNISCLLLYSKICGEEFGKLIATELVESFCSENGDELQKLQKSDKVGEDEKHFKEFENKIAAAVKNSITPILEFLQSQKYINIAMLISADQLLPHNHRVDAISFVSEYRSLMFQTKQIMSLLSETDNEVMIHAHDSIVMIRKIENSSLVVTINKNANNKKQIFLLIDKYCHIIGHILKLIASLGDYGTDSFQWSLNL